jgi:4-cresol dehydrogenase (hydroxylating)
MTWVHPDVDPSPGNSGSSVAARTEGDPNLGAALDAWNNLLGPGAVLTDAATLDVAARATLKTSTRPAGVLRPSTVAEVAAVLRIATEYAVPVYPISRGRNWGYGSRVAHVDRSVILDLGRLDRIRDFDEDLGYITIEPGVTQDQVIAFLRARGSRRILNHPGALGGISLLGNLLDRGFATFSTGPYENRSANCCNFEVVTARGEVLHTGTGRYPNAKVAALDDWGIGPQLQGVFLQSNLGVVTSATLWLAPRAPFPQHLLLTVDDQNLPRLIDALHTIREAVAPRARFHVFNRYRYAANLKDYPWHLTNGATPLPREALLRLTGPSVKEWTCVGLQHCASRPQRRAETALIKHCLADLDDHVRFINPDLAAWFRRLAGPIERVTGHNVREAVDAFYDGRMVRDFNDRFSINQMYWRRRGPKPADVDPDRDRCGIIWFFPMIPWRGREVREAASACTRVMESFGLEPVIAVRFPADRTALLACSILYDRDVPGEDDRADECYSRLVAEMGDGGYYPYRLGIQGMDLLPAPVDDSAMILNRLKAALDPSDVLAPGRYDLRKDWPQGEPV